MFIFNVSVNNNLNFGIWLEDMIIYFFKRDIKEFKEYKWFIVILWIMRTDIIYRGTELAV